MLSNKEGTAQVKAKVKDEIPAGTEFVEGSIKVLSVEKALTGEKEKTLTNLIAEETEIDLTTLTSENLATGIEVELQAGEEKTLEFKVKVKDIENNSTIKNVAKVNKNPENPDLQDEPTNEVEHIYVEPIITEIGRAHV